MSIYTTAVPLSASLPVAISIYTAVAPPSASLPVAMTERLRWQTRNLLGSARAGSNPAGHESLLLFLFLLLPLLWGLCSFSFFCFLWFGVFALFSFFLLLPLLLGGLAAHGACAHVTCHGPSAVGRFAGHDLLDRRRPHGACAPVRLRPHGSWGWSACSVCWPHGQTFCSSHLASRPHLLLPSSPLGPRAWTDSALSARFAMIHDPIVDLDLEVPQP
eukprot:scaffold125808_cov39-Tisochrysis_lutea.AAC.1